jgi:hypothetical protein
MAICRCGIGIQQKKPVVNTTGSLGRGCLEKQPERSSS